MDFLLSLNASAVLSLMFIVLLFGAFALTFGITVYLTYTESKAKRRVTSCNKYNNSRYVS